MPPERRPLDEEIPDLEFSGIKLGLESVRSFLESCGDPQKKFRSIHIAGTNGKGSTAAMIASILQAAGLKTGLYTSPHLITLRERFQINGRLISPEALEGIWSEVERQGARSLTFFEAMTALAFLWFAREKVDVAILETGLGGRLDATNVVVPEVGVITSIGLEHQQFLGDTLEAIAGEKAGIIKPKIPVVVGPLPEPALNLVKKHAGELAAPCEEIHSLPNLKDLHVALPGEHQKINAALAIAAVRHFSRSSGKAVTTDAIRGGLLQTSWPGRLQWLEGGRVLLDGAHNPAAAAVLADYLKNHVRPRPVTLVFGCLEDKNAGALLATLQPFVSRFILTRAPGKRARSPQSLAMLVPFQDAVLEEDPVAAMAAARRNLPADGIVLVTGSLYLVGAVLKSLALTSPA